MSKRTVLVVDDDQAVADALVAMFILAGFSASAAYDAESALESARLIPPCFLIAEVVLPGMNGVDLASAVQHIAPDCRVLICSRVTTEATLPLFSLQSGCKIVFLSKPIHPSELLVHVTALLNDRIAA